MNLKSGAGFWPSDNSDVNFLRLRIISRTRRIAYWVSDLCCSRYRFGHELSLDKIADIKCRITASIMRGGLPTSHGCSGWVPSYSASLAARRASRRSRASSKRLGSVKILSSRTNVKSRMSRASSSVSVP